ncbi:MAG: DUF2877 domain-containing protein [Saezia sp.]
MISVLRADAKWLDQLSHGIEPSLYKVHSVFDRAANLQDDQGKLYTLVGSALGLAPDTMSLSCVQVADLNLHVGDSVVGSNTGFMLGNAFVGFEDAARWDSGLPVYQDFDLTAVLELMDELLQEETCDKNMLEKAFYRHLEALCQDVERGFLQADDHLIKLSLERMVGLGIGLTPSGDDVLVGLCAVLAVPGYPVAKLFPFCQEAIAKAQGKTNEISYTALLHAAKGHFNERLIHCLDCMFKGNEKALEEALQAVLAIGSSSGADMLRGVRMGLLFDKRSEQNVHKNSS